jgi:hypothetical protein
MTEHTPGPWVHEPECAYGWDIRNHDDTVWIGQAHNAHEKHHGFPSDKEGAANARLMAAAPELLKALEDTLSWLTSYPGGGTNHVYDKARIAIAKARPVVFAETDIDQGKTETSS